MTEEAQHRRQPIDRRPDLRRHAMLGRDERGAPVEKIAQHLDWTCGARLGHDAVVGNVALHEFREPPRVCSRLLA